MSEQITWTHVDKLVRKMLDDRMQMACGTTDAEVTYNMIKFLERSLSQAELCAQSLGATNSALQRQLKEAQQAPKLGKTKQRLAKLEAAVAELQKQPGHNFIPAFHEGLAKAAGCCAKDGCDVPKGRNSHYCDKCERDL